MHTTHQHQLPTTTEIDIPLLKADGTGAWVQAGESGMTVRQRLVQLQVFELGEKCIRKRRRTLNPASLVTVFATNPN